MKKLLLIAALLPSTILANSTILDVETIDGDNVQITQEEAMRALSETAEPVFKADLEQFGKDSVLYVNPKIKYGNEYIPIGAQIVSTVGPKFCDYIQQGDYQAGQLYKTNEFQDTEVLELYRTNKGYILNVTTTGLIASRAKSIACKIKPKKEQSYYFNSDTNSLFSM